MKGFYLRISLFSFVLMLLSACASTDEVASDSALKTGGAVPGEKTADEPGAAQVGPGSAAAGVRW